MKTVLLDTNALMAVGEFHLDIFSALREACDFPYTVAVLQGTVQELQGIAGRQREKYSRAAKLALQLLQKHRAGHNVHVLAHTLPVDDALVEHSRHGFLVLTQDKALKKRLRKPYLTLRQKKRIVVMR